MSRFADWLWEQVKGSTLTQGEIAEAIGIGQATLSRYLNGQATPERRKTIHRMATYFGVSDDYLRDMIEVSAPAGESMPSRKKVPSERIDILLDFYPDLTAAEVASVEAFAEFLRLRKDAGGAGSTPGESA